MNSLKDLTYPYYLSVVVPTRNDIIGGNALKCLQTFIDLFQFQAQQYNLNAELIIVEWNPPHENKRLSDAIISDWGPSPCPVRIITVPFEIHEQFCNSDKIELFQMIAKNVGIRHAQGQYVLATNIDVIFSNELIKFISEKKLDGHRMYRVERFDIPSDAPTNKPVMQLLEYCKRNVIRKFKYLSIEDLVLGTSKNVHWKLNPIGKLIEIFQEQFCRKSLKKPLRLHTNASGDFTLMSSQAWNEVRGYPEFEIFAMHIDSLLCYMAHHSGFKEKVLKSNKRIYHIDHGQRTDGSARYSLKREKDILFDDKDLFVNEIQSKNILRLTSSQMYHWARWMRINRAPILFNTKDWGLSNFELIETKLQ